MHVVKRKPKVKTLFPVCSAEYLKAFKVSNSLCACRDGVCSSCMRCMIQEWEGQSFSDCVLVKLLPHIVFFLYCPFPLRSAVLLGFGISRCCLYARSSMCIVASQ